MIRKFVFGSPIDTEAAVMDIPETKGDIPFFEYKDGCFSRRLEKEDITYGLGQQVGGINKRGHKYVSCNLDNPHHQEDTLSLYGAHNFLIISGKELFGVFFDCGGKITFDIGFTKESVLSVQAEYPDMTVYIITGEDENDITTQLRKLTGRSYAAPKWAFGYGQSRWGYKSAEDIRAVERLHRENGIPLDMIYLDIDYMERFKDFTVNEETFPGLEGFAAEMLSRGIRLIPIIDAGVKIEDGYNIYEEGKEKGYFCKDEKGNDFIAAVWPGKVHFPDTLNRDARKWFGRKYDILLKKGIEGFWNDMNEPAVFYTEKRLEDTVQKVKELSEKNMGINEFFELTGSINSLANNPEDMKLFFHSTEQGKIRHDRVHNLYGYNMTRAASEAFDELCPEKRILLFSRSSYIGAHRYGGIWQGDNKSWWSHLLMNIQMTCNLNMTGFLFTGADIGGFNSDTSEDLMLRWLQFAVFTPLMRNHSAMGTREQEIFRFENMENCRRMIKLRYVLLPYIYSEYIKAVINDGMMFKPLGFVFKDGMSRQTEDQLLLGDEVMLAPVYKQNSQGRYVWLPEEMMLVRMRSAEDIQTEIMPMGHHYISMGHDELVFFIRKDRAIPISSGGMRVGDIGTGSLVLTGYEGCGYELYDDDGISKSISEKNIRVIK